MGASGGRGAQGGWGGWAEAGDGPTGPEAQAPPSGGLNRARGARAEPPSGSRESDAGPGRGLAGSRARAHARTVTRPPPPHSPLGNGHSLAFPPLASVPPISPQEGGSTRPGRRGQRRSGNRRTANISEASSRNPYEFICSTGAARARAGAAPRGPPARAPPPPPPWARRRLAGCAIPHNLCRRSSPTVTGARQAGARSGAAPRPPPSRPRRAPVRAPAPPPSRGVRATACCVSNCEAGGDEAARHEETSNFQQPIHCFNHIIFRSQSI